MTTEALDQRWVRLHSGFKRTASVRQSAQHVTNAHKKYALSGAATTAFRAKGASGLIAKVADAAASAAKVDSTRAAPARPRALDDALAALSEVALHGARTPALWMEAARKLERAAVEEDSRAPRRATLAISLADALACTSPEEVDEAGLESLKAGYRLLFLPYISSDAERDVFRGLLRSRWTFSAPYDEAVWAPFAERHGHRFPTEDE